MLLNTYDSNSIKIITYNELQVLYAQECMELTNKNYKNYN